MTEIFLLLILFQFKHFIADFPLQGTYMLGKFKSGTEWILPLLAHVSVHGLFTFIITTFFVSTYLALCLTLLDMSIHFIMDRIKASPKMLGRFKPKQKYFWWSLGLDQMVHHMTHYFIIFLILTNTNY